MKVSVCIASHNGERYIESQLRSILDQLGANDEVVISDDGSMDNTLKIIRSLEDIRVRIIDYTHKVKSKFPLDYATHNFVNAIKHAKGDVIFLSDQDDVWLPGHVEKMKKELDKCELVVCDCKITDESLNVIYESKFRILNVHRGIIRNLWSNGCYQGSCMAFRKCVFERALPFPYHYVGHDLWLGLVAESFFRVKMVPIPLLLYRRRNESITFTGKKNTNSIWFKIHYRFYIIKELLFKRLRNRRIKIEE